MKRIVHDDLGNKVPDWENEEASDDLLDEDVKERIRKAEEADAELASDNARNDN